MTKTVAPEGVNRFQMNDGLNNDINQEREGNGDSPTLVPNHKFKTEYQYNSLNQLVKQETPDGGITRFAYDRLGRIIASQNANQILGEDKRVRFSYTKYDELGRITEAGEVKVSPWWLVGTYGVITIGELCLSPVGLSAVTKLSPAKIVGFMMGVWFLATASSEFIASVLANIASIDTSNGLAPDLNLAKQSYLKLFEYLFYTGIGFGLLLLILSPVIKRLMHGVDKELNN